MYDIEKGVKTPYNYSGITDYQYNYEKCLGAIKIIATHFDIPDDDILISSGYRSDNKRSQHYDCSAIDFKSNKLTQIFKMLTPEHRRLLSEFKDMVISEDQTIYRQFILEHAKEGISKSDTIHNIYHVGIYSQRFKEPKERKYKFVHSLRYRMGISDKVVNASMKEILIKG